MQFLENIILRVEDIMESYKGIVIWNTLTFELSKLLSQYSGLNLFQLFF